MDFDVIYGQDTNFWLISQKKKMHSNILNVERLEAEVMAKAVESDRIFHVHPYSDSCEIFY